MPPADSLIRRFSDVQTLPYAVSHLARLMADDTTNIKQLEEVITMDPVLVVRLLKLVNSPYYGLLQKVASVNHAITLLGMKNLYNIVVTEAIKVFFIKRSTSSAFSRQKLWLHCAAVSICAKMIAERIFEINGDDAYLAGILHDFGLIIEDQVEPDIFIEICRECSSNEEMVRRERLFFDTDHSEIASEMLTQWSMPVTIRNAIRNHHNMQDDVEPDSLTGILQIAEYLVEAQGYTALPANKPVIPLALRLHIEELLDEYTVLIEDFPEEMKKARSLYGIGVHK